MDAESVIGPAILVCVVVCGAFGRYIAQQRGRPEGEGIIFGAVLGPIGLLILAMMPAGPVATRAEASADDDGPDSIDFTAIPDGGKGAVDPLAPRRTGPPPLPRAGSDRPRRKLLGEVDERG